MGELGIGVSVMSIANEILTIRIAVETFLKDRHKYKSIYVKEKLLWKETLIIFLDLELWRKLWGISDKTPIELYQRLWGNEGAKEIHDTMESTFLYASDIRHDFQLKYKRKVSGDVESNGNIETSSLSDPASSKLHLRKPRKGLSMGRRVRLALFESPIFEDRLEIMKRYMFQLKELAEKYYHIKWDLDEGDIKESIQETASQHYLIELAKKWKSQSQQLAGQFQTALGGDLTWQIDSAYGGASSDRLRTIIERSSSEEQHLFLQHQRDTWGRILNFRTPRANLSAIDSVQRLTLDKILMSLPDQGDFASHKYFLSNESEDFIQLQLVATSGKVQQDSTVLSYTLRSDRPIVLRQSLHESFSRQQRIKLAYELSEAVLIFLKTERFSGLCRCMIIRSSPRLESSDDSCSYWYHLNHPSLCPESSTGSTLRRLGQLLADIATGKPSDD